VDSRVIADRVGKEGGMPVGASILVTAVDPRGPASQAGLLPGDLIVAVDGRVLLHQSLLCLSSSHAFC
jgi:S1-C subfamily serine protease